MSWFTSKDGKHINTDWFNQDRQISENEKEAKTLNNKTVKTPAINETTIPKFVKDVKSAKASRREEDAWRVDDTYTEKDYIKKDTKCYSSLGGSVVAVTETGDIISVCKKSGDRTTTGANLLYHAVRMGGTKLDSFAGNHQFYTDNGFEAVSWTPFNVEYAPDDWKAAKAKGLYVKEEEVIFYRYVGVGNVKTADLGAFLKNPATKFTGDDGYDNAYAFRDSKIKK